MVYTEVIDDIDARLRGEYPSAEVAITGITTLFTQAIRNIVPALLSILKQVPAR
jgi:hypothetical protein